MKPLSNELRNGVLSLWQSVFGDDKEFITFYLNNFSTPENISSIFKDSKMIGMGHSPLFNTIIGKTAYLYAVAVDPKERGKGHATKIINDLLKKAYLDGAIATFLIPADDDLREWYDAQFQFCTLPSQGIIKFNSISDFNFGGDTEEENIPAIRILNVEKYLTKYISIHPNIEIDINVIDTLIPENQAHFYHNNKNGITRTNFSNNNPITISELYRFYPIQIIKAQKL